MQEPELREFYRQLIDQNGRAFAGRRFEVAYHCLAAALHCGEGLRDEGLLGAVQRLAEDQGTWIDANAPEHRLSSHHASMRGNSGIFPALARQAHAVLLHLTVDRQAEELKRINDGTG